MPLFVTRRTYNAAQGKFTHNASALTRYISVPPGVLPNSQHIIDKGLWLDQVKAKAAGGDILIFVHGFNTEQHEMLNRLAKIEANLGAEGWNGLTVAFDWPSDGTVLAYASDRTDAKKVAPFLVIDLIGPLLNLRPQPRVHLLCHSMGAYLTLRSFSGTGDSGSPGTVPWGVDEVALVAADVDKPWMETGAWGSLVMDLRSKRLTNYYSTFDQVLDLAENIIHGQERAGRNGLPVSIPAKFNDVYCGAQYEDKVPPKDKTLRGSHNWYFNDAGFYRDLALTLKGKAAANMPTRRPTAGSSDQALLT